MISFKQFLNESRSYPLYHATGYRNLDKILAAGFDGTTYQTQLKFGTVSRGWYGVSTARTKRAAIDYYHINVSTLNEYVVFELDHAAIANNYKIFPVAYFKTQQFLNRGQMQPDKHGNLTSNEEEEFIIISNNKYSGSDGFLPSKYIKRIFVVPTTSSPAMTSRSYFDKIEKVKSSKIGRKYEWRSL